MTHPMKVDLSNDKQMVLTRRFDAPRELVWKCWTDPGHMAAWWGPAAFTSRCDLEVKPGGKQLIVMLDPEGTEYPVNGVYLEVVEGEKLVSAMVVDDHPPEWHELFAAYKGTGDDAILNLVMTVTFADAGDGRTLVTVTQEFRTKADRDANMKMGAEAGWRESFVKLDTLLTRIDTTA